MWPERLLHVSQKVREIADNDVRGELFRFAQMCTPRTYCELSIYDAQYREVIRNLMKSNVDQIRAAENLSTHARATDFMVNERDWDYFTALHIVTKLERQGDLVLDEESRGVSWCWRNDEGEG